jgi:hypothetical protein
MPTGTNKSPLTLAPQLIMPLAKAGVGGFMGGLTGGVGEFQQLKREFKEDDFKSMSTGQKAKKLAGGWARMIGNVGMGQITGATQGLIGTDFGAREMLKIGDNAQYSNTGVAGVPQTQPEYTTNIDPNTGEEIDSPLTMSSKPLKALTSIEGKIPYNKSAKQHESALKMNKIAMSGISSKY